jgi:hypothetical protein
VCSWAPTQNSAIELQIDLVRLYRDGLFLIFTYYVTYVALVLYGIYYYTSYGTLCQIAIPLRLYPLTRPRGYISMHFKPSMYFKPCVESYTGRRPASWLRHTRPCP